MEGKGKSRQRTGLAVTGVRRAMAISCCFLRVHSSCDRNVEGSDYLSVPPVCTFQC